MAKVKVVLSWSGGASREVARVLREWLPSVIQTVDPFMSEEDIQKGATWLPALQQALAEPHFGIVCVTPDNMRAEWLQFEAGAMWKAFNEKRVCPFLFGIDSASDLKPPLGLFQACAAKNDDEVLRLMKSINAAAPEGERLPDATLQRSFEKWVPDLRDRLAKISLDAGRPQHRSQEDILSEILTTVRSIAQEQAWTRQSERGSEIRERLRRSMRQASRPNLPAEAQEMVDALVERLAARDRERDQAREQEVKRVLSEGRRESTAEQDPKT
jgi:hypothetical protein